MNAEEIKARLEAAGAGKHDLAFIAGVSVRAVRMACSQKGWHGRPVDIETDSPIAKALDSIEQGARAPKSCGYQALDKIYRRRKW